MKKDIILSGVGGQGILSIATVIGEAATACSIALKQAEVHGMSQRGGDVQSNLRLSDGEIFSDLIPAGKADLIISMEPMEALRYIPYLSKDGVIVTSSCPLKNIPNYPDEQRLQTELQTLPHIFMVDAEKMAKDLQAPRSANMILLGMAAPFIELLSAEDLRVALGRVFSRKGEKIVNDNIRCFDAGVKFAQDASK